MTYRIEAANEADAIARLFRGEAEPECQSQGYIEVTDTYGLPVEGHQELADALRALGVPVGDAVIPSVRSIKQL